MDPTHRSTCFLSFLAAPFEILFCVGGVVISLGEWESDVRWCVEIVTTCLLDMI